MDNNYNISYIQIWKLFILLIYCSSWFSTLRVDYIVGRSGERVVDSCSMMNGCVLRYKGCDPTLTWNNVPPLAQCWASVKDVGPGPPQFWANVLSQLGRYSHSAHTWTDQYSSAKQKRQYLLTCKVSRYFLLALHDKTAWYSLHKPINHL